MKRLILIIALLISFAGISQTQTEVFISEGYAFETTYTSAELASIATKQLGDYYFDSDLNSPVFWNGTEFTPYTSAQSFTTTELNALPNKTIGSIYYDSTQGQIVWWNGSSFVFFGGGTDDQNATEVALNPSLAFVGQGDLKTNVQDALEKIRDEKIDSVGVSGQNLNFFSNGNADGSFNMDQFDNQTDSDVTSIYGPVNYTNTPGTVNGALAGIDVALGNISGGGINNVVEDLTPQLGGALDAQNNIINNVSTLTAATVTGTTINADKINVAPSSGSAYIDFNNSSVSGYSQGLDKGALYFADDELRIATANSSTQNADLGINTAGLTSQIDLVATDSDITYNGTSLLGGGGLSNIVEDTTPQLGGQLDGQGNNISNAGTVTGTTANFQKININSGGANTFLDFANSSGSSYAPGLGEGAIYFIDDAMRIATTDSATENPDLELNTGALTVARDLTFTDSDVTYNGVSLTSGGGGTDDQILSIGGLRTDQISLEDGGNISLADTDFDADNILVADVGGNFTGTDVEAVLAELASSGGGSSNVSILSNEGFTNLEIGYGTNTYLNALSPNVDVNTLRINFPSNSSGSTLGFVTEELTDATAPLSSQITNATNGTVNLVNTTTSDINVPLDNLNASSANERYYFGDRNAAGGNTVIYEGTMSFVDVPDKDGDAKGSFNAIQLEPNTYTHAIEDVTDGEVLLEGGAFDWVTYSLVTNLYAEQSNANATNTGGLGSWVSDQGGTPTAVTEDSFPAIQIFPTQGETNDAGAIPLEGAGVSTWSGGQIASLTPGATYQVTVDVKNDDAALFQVWTGSSLSNADGISSAGTFTERVFTFIVPGGGYTAGAALGFRADNNDGNGTLWIKNLRIVQQ